MDPNPAPTPSTPQRSGFFLAWATLIGSTIAAFVLGAVIDAAVPQGSYVSHGLAAGMLPPLALLGLLGWAWFGGRREMALGIAVAFASMFALLLLGVGACFGLFALDGM
jgi:hypothetical protein